MAQQSITYVGKTSPYFGKTIWEIVGNLKNFGVGRILVRNSHLKEHDTPCYYRILAVETRPNLEPEKIQRFRWPNDHRHIEVRLKLENTSSTLTELKQFFFFYLIFGFYRDCAGQK